MMGFFCFSAACAEQEFLCMALPGVEWHNPATNKLSLDLGDKAHPT